MNKEFTLESFINWCDDMYIVNEASTGNSVMDSISDTLTRLYEFMRRIILTIKSKMSEGKFLEVPKAINEQLESFLSKQYNMQWYENPATIDDTDVERFERAWEFIKNTINEHSNDNNTVKVSLSKVYSEMNDISAGISHSLKGVKRCKSDISRARDYDFVEEDRKAITGYRNLIKVAKIATNVCKQYLTFKVISA